MKRQKYDVLFSKKNKSLQTGLKQIIADSPEEAFNEFLIGKEPNKFELVIVSSSGFWDFIKSPESFPNPLFRPDEIKDRRSEKGASENELAAAKKYYKKDSFRKHQSDKLDKLIEIQENQLYWVRFLGVVTLISLITAFVYIVIAMSSGRTRS